MKDLTRGNIYKTLLLFAVPIVLSGFLSQAYATINTILAGKLLGDTALAATGALSPFQTFVDSMIWGYGMGLGVYVSHLFGAQDYRKMKAVLVNNLQFLMTAVALLSAVFILFRYRIYGFLDIDPEIIGECDRYFILITAGKAIIYFGTCSVSLLNGMGESGFPLLVSSVSAICNILIGAFSIVVLKLGVAGLALGSVLAGIISGGLYLWKLGKSFKTLGIAGQKTPFSFSIIRQTAKYAGSTMVQQSVMYFAGLILSPMINGIGKVASASYTVTLRIYNINANIYQNSAKSVGNYTSQCYGAKKYHLLKKGVRVGVVQNLLFVAPTLLVCCLLPGATASLFFGADADPVAVGYSVDFFRYFLPFLVLNVFANLFHHFFRGIGRMRLLLITTLAGSAARILISWILIKPLGIYGYYIGWVFAWLVDAAVGAGLYFFGSWRKELTGE